MAKTIMGAVVHLVYDVKPAATATRSKEKD